MIFIFFSWNIFYTTIRQVIFKSGLEIILEKNFSLSNFNIVNPPLEGLVVCKTLKQDVFWTPEEDLWCTPTLVAINTLSGSIRFITLDDE